MTSSRSIDVAADHAAYPGHFPNFPVLPGAVLLDHALQIIAGETRIDLHAWEISSAKFLGAVRPGDALRIEFDAHATPVIRFTIFAAERKAVSGTLAALSRAAL